MVWPFSGGKMVVVVGKATPIVKKDMQCREGELFV
jgi:hypothetical protein